MALGLMPSNKLKHDFKACMFWRLGCGLSDPTTIRGGQLSRVLHPRRI